MRVIFKSDGNGTYRGFAAKFEEGKTNDFASKATRLVISLKRFLKGYTLPLLQCIG